MAVKLTGLKKAARKFAKGARRLSNPTEMNKIIALREKKDVEKRFATETDPDGRRWKPSRRVLRGGGKTLTKTGRLRGSIRIRANRNSSEVFTDIKYGVYHNQGAPNLPKRQFVGDGQGLRRNIIQTATKFIRDSFK